MPKYRRFFKLGNCYFLTLVTRERCPIFEDEAAVKLFWSSLQQCKTRYAFNKHAHVVIPDHIHILLELCDDSTPADLIRCLKRGFLFRIKSGGMETSTRSLELIHRFGTIWQSRYYDHVIRDEEDFSRHVDYIHFNPVKHGYVENPFVWKYSSIHEFEYQDDWGQEIPKMIRNMKLD
jgi:putative transposase